MRRSSVSTGRSEQGGRPCRTIASSTFVKSPTMPRSSSIWPGSLRRSRNMEDATSCSVAKSDLVEGDWQPVYPVIVEFADGEQARRWYSSPEYEPLKALRVAGTRSNAVFLEGATPQSRKRQSRPTAKAHRNPRPKSTMRCSFQRLFRQWGPIIAAEARIGSRRQRNRRRLRNGRAGARRA